MKYRLVFFLSFLGLLVAGYLSYEYLTASSINCPIGGAGCDIVRLSPYSSFFGISTPLVGVAYYLSMMVGVFLVLANVFSKLVKRLMVWATVFAVLIGVYLTYLEGFVIGAYCIWCLGSFMITVALLWVLFCIKDEQ